MLPKKGGGGGVTAKKSGAPNNLFPDVRITSERASITSERV